MEAWGAGRQFPDGAILIVGNAQTTGDNPINHQFNGFFITFVVDRKTGTVMDCSASVVLPLTDRFIRDLFIGRRLIEDEPEIVADVNERYHASSRKAIVVAYRDALKKYREVRGEGKPENKAEGKTKPA